MTLVVQDATGAKQNMSTTTDASGNLVGSTCVTDPNSGAKQAVSPQGSASVFSGGNNWLNVTAATVVKPTAGRAVRVSVITAGTTAGSVNDCATTAAAATANQFLSIPANQAAGTVYYIEWPCATGIVVTPGTGGVLAVSYA
jgi:hypothetical protein